VLAAGGGGGCTSWLARPQATLREPLPPRARVQLWVDGHAFVVHGVVVVGDSLRAVPYLRSPTCDSCALHWALRDIDSVRVPNAHSELSRRDFTTAVVASIIAVLILLIRLLQEGMKNY
jgi:hypothetical protein